MLAPESVLSPRPERCPRDVPLELTARHGLGCREREQVRARALLEHDPDFIKRGLRAGKKNEDGCSRNFVSASVAMRDTPESMTLIARDLPVSVPLYLHHYPLAHRSVSYLRTHARASSASAPTSSSAAAPGRGGVSGP